MSDDWQIGDLALCVDASEKLGWEKYGPLRLEMGRIYRVEAVTPPSLWDTGFYGPGLVLSEVKNNPNPDYAVRRFRKIRPDEHEACEEEFKILLKLSKKRVSA